MELQTTIYLFVGLSFALYLGIAFWARAGSTSEFYVAGGGGHPVTNGMATAADWMSAAPFISLARLIHVQSRSSRQGLAFNSMTTRFAMAAAMTFSTSTS